MGARLFNSTQPAHAILPAWQLCAKHDDRIELVSISRWHGNLDALFILSDLCRAAGEQGRADDLLPDGGQRDRIVFPLEYMNVDGLLLVRTGAPWAGFKRPATGRIKTFTVLAQPLADLAKTIRLARFDLTTGHGVCVQRQVSAAPGAADQDVNALLERFQLIVRFP